MVTELKRPIDVKTYEEIERMSTDNFPPDPSKWSILNGDNHVSIFKPNGGGYISIPKDDFDQIVGWYMRPQKIRGKQ